MYLFLLDFCFSLDLSFEVHEKFENISDHFEFPIDNDFFDLIDHFGTEFLQLPLYDAPIEMDPRLGARIIHVGKYRVKDWKLKHVRCLDSFNSEVYHDFPDHNAIPQLPPIFVNQHHLVSLVVIYAVVIILAHFILDKKIEL